MLTERFPATHVKPTDPNDQLQVGEWRALGASGELIGPNGVQRLEPKVMELLFVLASRPNEVFTREELHLRLWPETVVGDDSLARLVFKLRKAFGDDESKTPRFLETLPKRGYRLNLSQPPSSEGSNAVPELVEAPARSDRHSRGRRGKLILTTVAFAGLAVLAWQSGYFAAAPAKPVAAAPSGAEVIVDRANDFYFRYSREDNEAAIALFERLVGSHPDYAPAYAGLANALVQRVMRWPEEPPGTVYRSLRVALAAGHLRQPAARRTLERAEALALQAVALAPGDAASHKALGFVRSGREDFAAALASYQKAVDLDPNAWGAMINIADLLEIQGREEEGLINFEAAFAAMTRVYDEETTRVQPWYAETATAIGERHLTKGRLGEAETWFRRALEFTPLQPEATRGLARVLIAAGDKKGAEALCQELEARLGDRRNCPLPD